VKVVTWNVNSLKARADYVAAYLDANDPDVIGLQELKLTEDKVPAAIFTDRGYHLAIHGQKQWNGVLLASKTPLSDVVRGFDAEGEQSRFIAATVAGVRIINLYCPQGQAVDSPKFPYKLSFFEGLSAWLGGACDPAAPLIVMGDINIAPAPEDIYDPDAFAGQPSFHPDEHAAWRRLIDWGLTDAVRPHIPANTYSFWDYRGMAFRFGKGMRIDHVLVTAPLAGRVRSGWVNRDWRKKKGPHKASDHAPVGVDLDWP